jgi:hypothetical protein
MKNIFIKIYDNVFIKLNKAVPASTYKHSDKLGAGAKKRKKLKSKEDKFEVVMHEFAAGKLHSGSGEIVRDRQQALAIAGSESGKFMKEDDEDEEDEKEIMEKAVDIQEKIIAFIKKDPAPKDEDFHKFVEGLGKEHSIGEQAAYRMIGSIFAAGTSAKQQKKIDPKELAMGIKVEMEHTDNKLIAEKIATDHLTEFPKYYTALALMEKELKKEKMDKAGEMRPGHKYVRRAPKATGKGFAYFYKEGQEGKKQSDETAEDKSTKQQISAHALGIKDSDSKEVRQLKLERAHLQTKALKMFAGSHKQEEINKQVNDVEDKIKKLESEETGKKSDKTDVTSGKKEFKPLKPTDFKDLEMVIFQGSIGKTEKVKPENIKGGFEIEGLKFAVIKTDNKHSPYKIIESKTGATMGGHKGKSIRETIEEAQDIIKKKGIKTIKEAIASYKSPEQKRKEAEAKENKLKEETDKKEIDTEKNKGLDTESEAKRNSKNPQIQYEQAQKDIKNFEDNDEDNKKSNFKTDAEWEKNLIQIESDYKSDIENEKDDKEGKYYKEAKERLQQLKIYRDAVKNLPKLKNDAMSAGGQTELFKAINFLLQELQKAKAMPVGTVTGQYKKVAEDKWTKISSGKKKGKKESEPDEDKKDKQPEAKKQKPISEHKERMKGILKKMAGILADAFSGKGTVQAAGETAEQAGENLKSGQKKTQNTKDKKKPIPPEDTDSQLNKKNSGKEKNARN